ncbi:hypothetical protein [Psychrobacillus sp. FSL K6-2836]|uniref:hypothetical protein n=1 Tax=Psychrobacillus sp. FSL K6-2836 TaxID=2921548 RepID=UPI004040996C
MGILRFKSPKEFTLGDPIDSKTNVFNMGAIAFGLLGGEMDHSFSKWKSSPKLYEIAIRAVENNRYKRYSTIKEFYEARKVALK